MSHTFAALSVHVVFAPKNRRECLDDELRPDLFAEMKTLLSSLGCVVRAINGMPDHVHVLFRYPPRRALADIMRHLKSRSSAWIHANAARVEGFAWQSGYGAFSVSRSVEPDVREYIERQQEHHANRTYDDEFRALLRKHGFEPEDAWFDDEAGETEIGEVG